MIKEIYPPGMTVDVSDQLQSAYNRCRDYDTLKVHGGTHWLSKTLNWTGKPVYIDAVGATFRALNRSMTDPLVIYGGRLGESLYNLQWNGGRFLYGGGFVLQNISYSTIHLQQIFGNAGLILQADVSASYLDLSIQQVNFCDHNITIKLFDDGKDNNAWCGFNTISKSGFSTVNGGACIVENNSKAKWHPHGWCLDRVSFEAANLVLFDIGEMTMVLRDCHIEGDTVNVGRFDKTGQEEIIVVRPRCISSVKQYLKDSGLIVETYRE